jgi:flagellar transcriptional activator FlhD
MTTATAADTARTAPSAQAEQLLAEIREANLTYLMLAQNLIRKDRAEALFRLGLSEEAADLLVMLSPAQMLKIASSNMLLCRFRVDDDLVWNLLTNHNVKKVENGTTTRLHASILMAGRFADSMAAAH